jgi:antitoxin component YwqK of YwqJK toxin-antitoxin module
MKTKSSLTVIFLMMTSLILGQTSGLNQADSKGKKDGKWIVYLDKDWKKVDDSTKAIYCRYTYFDQGTNIYPMGPCGGKGYKLEPGSADKKPVLLEGEYKWYDANGKLSSTHVFKNGEYVSCKEYFPSGELSQHFDYTKKCEGQPHGWTVTVYDKKGNVKQSSATCKDKNGNWPPMRG